MHTVKKTEAMHAVKTLEVMRSVTCMASLGAVPRI